MKCFPYFKEIIFLGKNSISDISPEIFGKVEHLLATSPFIRLHTVWGIVSDSYSDVKDLLKTKEFQK